MPLHTSESISYESYSDTGPFADSSGLCILPTEEEVELPFGVGSGNFFHHKVERAVLHALAVYEEQFVPDGKTAASSRISRQGHFDDAHRSLPGRLEHNSQWFVNPYTYARALCGGREWRPEVSRCAIADVGDSSSPRYAIHHVLTGVRVSQPNLFFGLSLSFFFFITAITNLDRFTFIIVIKLMLASFLRRSLLSNDFLQLWLDFNTNLFRYA